MEAPDPGAMPGAPAPHPWNFMKDWPEYVSNSFVVLMRHNATIFQVALAVVAVASSLFAVYGSPGKGFEDQTVTITWICATIISCLLGFFWSLKSKRPYSFSLVAAIIAFIIHGKQSDTPEHAFADTVLALPLCIILGSIMAWLYFKSMSSGPKEHPLQTALEHLGVVGPTAA
ncbi:hypothetical protein CMUS01_12825 [Colletotrichum musicola]|uniref:Uncharacterized protein n=1 Tax=Colletotrichum musicola TaxID=2175873 RepID=A0A8H6JI07_9PEZI|nr:hypothetical protein CMUS01_12825 [Colletotrichum musicola]